MGLVVFHRLHRQYSGKIDLPELRWLLRNIEERRDTMLDLYTIDEVTSKEFPILQLETFTEQQIADLIRDLLDLTPSVQVKFRKAENTLSYCVIKLCSSWFSNTVDYST